MEGISGVGPARKAYCQSWGISFFSFGVWYMGDGALTGLVVYTQYGATFRRKAKIFYAAVG